MASFLGCWCTCAMGWLCLLEITRQRHLLKSLKVTTCNPRIIIQGWQGKQERDHWEAWCSKAYIVDLSPWQENFKTEFEVQNLVKDRKILWLAKHPDLRKVLTWVGRSKQWHAITQLELMALRQCFNCSYLWLCDWRRSWSCAGLLCGCFILSEGNTGMWMEMHVHSGSTT